MEEVRDLDDGARLQTRYNPIPHIGWHQVNKLAKTDTKENALLHSGKHNHEKRKSAAKYFHIITVAVQFACKAGKFN